MTVTERFLSYVAYPTMSNEDSLSVPSTEKQIELAKKTAADLKQIGLTDVYIDKYGYVYGTLEANTDEITTVIGFIAHMDTSPEANDEDITPQVVSYNGGDIVLNKQAEIILSTNVYPSLERYKGQRLIVTDGTTLLGADDKAGIAEIITALENIIKNGVKHGTVKVAFTPDEEIGRGADKFDVATFGADYAYTVDGGALGELEYENFNAASAEVTFYGVSIHPGSAKGIMKNACLMALEFDSLLPKEELPSKTEGYEGFHHLTSMNGAVECASLSYIIRDHDRAEFERKKDDFIRAANEIRNRYGNDAISITINDSYYNMKELIEQNIDIVECVKTAMLAAGVEPLIKPIRGGTDGARLSYMGLLCPNICTGGENFHSRFEYISVEAMEKTTEIIENIIIGVRP